MENIKEAAISGKRFLGIPVPDGLRRINFFSLYLASLCAACLMTIPAILQPLFLKEVISIPPEQAGSINSGLQNMTQIAMLLFVGMIGILSDKVGRRILAVFGFLLCAIFFVLFGHAKDISLAVGITSVGGQLFVTYLIRFIIGIGIFLAFPQFITMIADYTTPRHRGKGMAYNGVMMAMGSMITFVVMAQLAKKTGLMSLFYITAGIGVLGLIITRLGLVDHMPKEKAKRLGVKEIYGVVSRSLPLKASYLTTLFIRADVLVLGTFLIVWTLYASEKFGLTPVEATVEGGKVMAVMSVAGILFPPFVGVLLDRVGRVPVLIIGAFAAGTGMCLMAFTNNPFSPLMYIYVIFSGVGFSSAALGAMTLASDVSPKQLLGSILGGLNTMQPIGVLFFLQVGGFLFDKYGYWTPFALKGVANLGLGVWLLVMRSRIKAETEEVASIDSLPFTMEWEDEAKAGLQRVPGAFRKAAVSGTEEYARTHSYDKVTPEVMAKYRKELGM
jgi:DHA1 family tetracycline resistance protein-like MFS transporter